MRKRLSAIVLACVLACGMMAVLAGCAGGDTYEPEGKSPTVTSPAIGQSGTLRVGVDTEKSPLAGMSSDGERIIGIDVDVAAAIADELGLKLSIVDVGSDPAGALSGGKVDMVMDIDSSDAPSGVWVSEQYVPTGIALFALSSSKAGLPAEDANPLIAAQLSSTSAWAVSNTYGDTALKSVVSLSDAFSQLNGGSVKYVAADAIIGMYAAYIAGVDVEIVGMLAQPSGYCIAVSSANADLKTAVEDAVVKLTGNGVVGVIEAKWLGQAIDFTGIKVAGATAKASEAETDAKAEADAKTETDEADEASKTQAAA